MKNADLPAMPISSDNQASDLACGKLLAKQLAGLTKREMFAMAAMQGLLASLTADDDLSSEVLARCAVLDADALLKELERTE